MGCNCGKKREAFQQKLNANQAGQNMSLQPTPVQPIQTTSSTQQPKLTPRQERIMRRQWRFERRKRIEAREALAKEALAKEALAKEALKNKPS